MQESNGRGQIVAEDTKQSRNIQRTPKIIELDWETHVSFEGKAGDCRVGGWTSGQYGGGSRKQEGGKQEDGEGEIEDGIIGRKGGEIDYRTERWRNYRL